jgi:hypothetical protein
MGASAPSTAYLLVRYEPHESLARAVRVPSRPCSKIGPNPIASFMIGTPLSLSRKASWISAGVVGLGRRMTPLRLSR